MQKEKECEIRDLKERISFLETENSRMLQESRASKQDVKASVDKFHELQHRLLLRDMDVKISFLLIRKCF